MRVHNVIQRSTEWHALRVGCLTGTCAADMLATVKSGEAAGRKNLLIQKVLERVTGKSQDRTFVTPAMQDGIDREQDALDAYAAMSGNTVLSVGFMAHDELHAGCSPDGVVEE